MPSDWSKLKRDKHLIPEDILNLLEKEKLRDRYEARPVYQQNDYIGWITGAKRPATREKRLTQIIAELKKGDVYMNMDWRAKK